MLSILFGCISCNEREDKEYTDYNTKGIAKTVYKRSNGNVHGFSRFYDEKDRLIGIYQYKNGKLDGRLVRYFGNGQIESTLMYNNNLRNGSSLYFHKNSQLYVYTQSRNDTLIYGKEYDSTGKCIKEYRELKIASPQTIVRLGDTLKIQVTTQTIQNYHLAKVNYDYYLKTDIPKQINYNYAIMDFNTPSIKPIYIVPEKKGAYKYFIAISFFNKKFKHSYPQHLEGEFVCE